MEVVVFFCLCVCSRDPHFFFNLLSCLMHPLNTSLFLVLLCLVVVPLAGIFWMFAPFERKWERVVNRERT